MFFIWHIVYPLPYFCAAGSISILHYPTLFNSLVWRVNLPYLNLFGFPCLDSKQNHSEESIQKFIQIHLAPEFRVRHLDIRNLDNKGYLYSQLHWNAAYCSRFFWLQRTESQLRVAQGIEGNWLADLTRVQWLSLFEAQLYSVCFAVAVSSFSFTEERLLLGIQGRWLPIALHLQ